MIFDKLKNAAKYNFLDEKFKKAFDFLNNEYLENLKDGKYEIEGDKIYANIQSLTTKPKEEKKWEAHRKYIDIQYVIKGEEAMGFGIIDDFTTAIEYNSEKDVEFLEGKKFSFVNVSEGEFVIFYPQDVHAPMLAVENQREIKKVIIKIAI